ncbi:MAG: PaaI family thioesterase [Pseudomonadota bacterium]
MSDFDPHAFFNDKDAPPAPKHLGWKLLDFDTEKGWIKLGFTPKPQFLNFGGTVQGGFITAMLDDTLGPSAIIKAQKPILTQTIDLHVHFMRPVFLKPITTEGICTRLGRSIAYTEANLFNEDGELCARATSSAKVSDIPGGADAR